MDEGLVLEEVQMSPGLLLGIMGLGRPSADGARERSTPMEFDIDMQFAGVLVELDAF